MIAILSWETLFWAIGALVAWTAYTAISRVYFSPLAKIPGPKLAALTYWYEIYYDIIVGPRFPWKVEELHENYGPIIRISPDQIHINDPDYAPTHFAPGSSKRDKYDPHRSAFGNPEATLHTTSHDHHKLRRGALAMMFSKRKIKELEPYIVQIADKMCSRLEGFKASRKVLDLRLLFTCYATDVITEHGFARCKNFLSTEDLSPVWRDMVNLMLLNYHFFKHFPFMWTVIRSIPDNVVTWLAPDMKLMIDFENGNKEHVNHVLNTDRKEVGRPTIFHSLLHSDLPPSEKSAERLWQEGQTVVGAGTETLSNTLSVLMYYILANPAIYAKLKEGLHTHAPTPETQLSWQQLETLPYLTAVIQESLRMSHGVSSPVIRVAPNQELRYKDWTIPAGTAVGMNIMTLNNRPEMFPNPHEFVPERWLEKKEPSPEMWSFSKGPRMCVGMNLAYAELYLAVAPIVLRFDFELFETTVDDVTWVFDGFSPFPSHESKGIRVIVN